MDSPDLDLDALLIEGQSKRELLRQPTRQLACAAVVYISWAVVHPLQTDLRPSISGGDDAPGGA